MKFLFTAILFNIFLIAAAQKKEGPIKYLWQNEPNKIKALIEIYSSENKKKEDCLYFLCAVDTVFNSSTDSIFKIILDSSSFSTIVKISFYQLSDSNKLALLTNEIMLNILPDINKKYSKPIRHNVITGINDFALPALNISLNFPNTFNKTGLLFKNYKPDSLYIKNLEASFKNMRGKLFMYINLGGEQFENLNYLADVLALNSNINLYKYEADQNGSIKNIFTEAFNWLLADGNNFIIKTGD